MSETSYQWFQDNEELAATIADEQAKNGARNRVLDALEQRMFPADMSQLLAAIPLPSGDFTLWKMLDDGQVVSRAVFMRTRREYNSWPKRVQRRLKRTTWRATHPWQVFTNWVVEKYGGDRDDW